MDFYEELGLPRTATPDEIRAAYRQRARLFHPDRYPDAELRAVADTEMQRVNYIAGILTHPEEKLQYDLTLSGEGATAGGVKERFARPLPSRPRLRSNAVLWLAAGAAASLTCVLLALRFDPANVPAMPLVAASSAPTPLAHPAKPESIPELVPLFPLQGKERVNIKAPVVDLDRPNRTPVLPRRESAGANKPLSMPAAPSAKPTPANSESRPAEPVVEARVDSADTPLLLSPEEIVPVHRSHGLVGLWRYTSPAKGQAPSGVLAQEVEVGITRQSGTIYGYFEGCYIVSQKPAAREVSFQFSGTAGDESATTTWSSTDGSRGEISLHMLSEDSLEVIWVASHVGRLGRLASGKITLVRVE